jgi:hypothetical protein
MSAMISKNIFGLRFGWQLNCLFLLSGKEQFFFLGGRFFQLVVRKKTREMK